MSFPSTTEWDIRTTGSDSNGGAFNTASSGTDYSQQDSPQITYTDLVIGGTNTQLTSAANPFTAAHVGNVINVTGGTGFTTGRYLVSSVASGVATMDRAVGTAGSTGGAGKLGGAMANLVAALNALASSNTGGSGNGIFHLKAGTYTYTSKQTFPQQPTSGWMKIVGYQTSHNDGGTKPLITTATNSVDLISIGAASPVFISNVSFSCTAATKGYGIFTENAGSAPDLTLSDCMVDGFAYGVNGDFGKYYSFNQLTLIRTEVKNSVSGGVIQASGAIRIFDSYIHSNGGYGVQNNGTAGEVRIDGSLIVGNTGPGLIVALGTGANLSVSRSTIANNTSDGVRMAFALSAQGLRLFANNIIYGNGGWGVTLVSTDGAKAGYATRVYSNAFGSNTSGDRNNLAVGLNDKSLTANPFTNAGSGDYSLNATAGGGASCKGAGFPGVFPGGTTTGYLDIGAAQSQGGGGGGGGPVNFGWIG